MTLLPESCSAFLTCSGVSAFLRAVNPVASGKTFCKVSLGNPDSWATRETVSGKASNKIAIRRIPFIKFIIPLFSDADGARSASDKLTRALGRRPLRTRFQLEHAADGIPFRCGSAPAPATATKKAEHRRRDSSDTFSRAAPCSWAAVGLHKTSGGAPYRTRD